MKKTAMDAIAAVPGASSSTGSARVLSMIIKKSKFRTGTDSPVGMMLNDIKSKRGQALRLE